MSAEAAPAEAAPAEAAAPAEEGGESGGGCCSCLRCCSCGGNEPAEPQLITVAPGENYILKHNRCCTDLHMLLVFMAFWGAMFAVMAHAWDKGNTSLIIYGYDWKVTLAIHLGWPIMP